MTLQPHRDDIEGLDNSKEKTFKLVVLTIEGKTTLEKQMKSSGLESQFDVLYSFKAVRKFKFHPGYL